jgi:hypothetical protein
MKTLLIASVAMLIAVAMPAETRAQSKKTSVPGSGSAKAKEGAATEELYGDQGGEKVLPATSRSPNAVMRARAEDTFFKLSNPRVEQPGGKGRNALLVDYEVVSRGKLDGGTLVFRTEDGGRSEIALNSVTGRDSGTIQLVGVKYFGNVRLARNTTFPNNLEMYVIRVEERFDPPVKYMVSNSTVMGKMKSITRARNWTAKEIKVFNKGPLAYKNPNAHQEVGEDVPPLPGNLGHVRFVDPNGRLLGLDYGLFDWDKRKTVARLTPVFNVDQPRQHSARSIAKKGYAVAGAEVNLDKYVCGIRLLFQRVKPDGTFDTKDAYAGQWIGVPPAAKATTLANDGRRVLGIHFQHGAVLDRFSLVVDGDAK